MNIRFVPDEDPLLRLHWRVESNLADCQQVWRALEAEAFGTAFQCHEWISTWERAFQAVEEVQPRIVIGSDAAGQPQILLPLGLESHFGGVRRLCWLAETWSDYGMPLVRPDLAARLRPEHVQALWSRVAAMTAADIVVLNRQPEHLDGKPNPFAGHAGMCEASAGHVISLEDGQASVDAVMGGAKSRSRLRQKENGLRKLGAIRYRRHDEPLGASQAMALVLDWKVQAVASRGERNPLDNEAARRFLIDLAESVGGLAVVYSLELDGRMIAGMLTLVHRGRAYLYQMAYDPGETARFSPGQLLLSFVLKQLVDAGVTAFDLGYGDEEYKRKLTRDPPVLLGRSIKPVTFKGVAAAGEAALRLLVKQEIKKRPAALSGLRHANALLGKVTRPIREPNTFFGLGQSTPRG